MSRVVWAQVQAAVDLERLADRSDGAPQQRFSASLDRNSQRVERFVQSVKEHPWASHWIPPTGYLTDYNAGHPTKTSRRSLPL
jgi:hypothetical protein